MMIGEKKDISVTKLNAIIAPIERFEGKLDEIKPYHVLMKLDDYVDIDYLDLTPAEHFRSQALDEGFKLTGLYPVYHQGWEMDEWAASATKDDKEYWLTTNHGCLVVEEVKEVSLVSEIKRVLRSLW